MFLDVPSTFKGCAVRIPVSQSWQFVISGFFEKSLKSWPVIDRPWTLVILNYSMLSIPPNTRPQTPNKCLIYDVWCVYGRPRPQAPIINNHFFISSLVFSTPEVKHLVVPSSTLGDFLLFMSLVFENLKWLRSFDLEPHLPPMMGSLTPRINILAWKSRAQVIFVSTGLGTTARLPNCTHLTLKSRRSSPMLRKFSSLHHVWMHFRLSSVALKAFLSQFHTRPTFSLRLISNSIANPRFLISQSLFRFVPSAGIACVAGEVFTEGEKNQFQPFSRWRRVPNPSFLD